MDRPGTVVEFPHKPRKSAEQKRVERYGLRPPGHILRVPRELAGDRDRQCAFCELLLALTVGWNWQLRRKKALSDREIAAMANEFSHAASGLRSPPVPRKSTR